MSCFVFVCWSVLFAVVCLVFVPACRYGLNVVCCCSLFVVCCLLCVCCLLIVVCVLCVS